MKTQVRRITWGKPRLNRDSGSPKPSDWDPKTPSLFEKRGPRERDRAEGEGEGEGEGRAPRARRKREKSRERGEAREGGGEWERR